MKAVIQRVSKAKVTVEGKVTGQIGKGMVILLGVKEGDTEEEVSWLARKCVNLRIFEDQKGNFNLSALETEAELLVISQFTLYGDCRKGRRPSFTEAAQPAEAEKLYKQFVEECRQTGLKVETGIFGAMMEVEIHNSGPVTLIPETR
jgi:D-tyrosyl-tRNA(Tyr) deacylase